MVADLLDLAQRVVHEGWVGERSVGHTGPGDEVVHSQRGGDQPGPVGDRGSLPERRNTHHVPDLVGGERAGRRLSEPRVCRLQARRRWVRRDEPEHGVSAGEGPVDHASFAVRTHHHLGALSHLDREFGGVACDDTKFLVPSGGALEEKPKGLATNVTGRSGDHDHGNHVETLAGQSPIPLPAD